MSEPKTGFREMTAPGEIACSWPGYFLDLWTALQFGGQMSYLQCRNYCVLSEYAVIQTQNAVAGR